MPSIPLHLSPAAPPNSTSPPNPLPPLLHTPLGTALLELQGSFHFPISPPTTTATTTTSIGTLEFPPDFGDGNKKVWMYVGANQRLTGELRRAEPPLGVLRRRTEKMEVEMEMESGSESERERWHGEELEIVEVVRWKLVFAQRPEPVGSF
ncbi:chromosome transmission fidelity protein 8 [Sphaerosporella brunnea]|uniref:Chromosome transmission fidelity protein 8 n=1 Tax=Sphaerosporella brunnea TaxID=1250544 RepID=A0A5J5F3Y9_9PEZI|nr:chromosome transmission fidelity protein 8 [Sphaerosporella brunnea]